VVVSMTFGTGFVTGFVTGFAEAVGENRNMDMLPMRKLLRDD